MNDLLARVAILNELQVALIEPRIRQMGGSWSIFQLLSTLQGHGKPISQAEVARRLEITPATLCEQVAVLVRKGLIEQVPSTRDARVKNLRIQPMGKQLLQKMVKEFVFVEKEMVKGISPRELTLVADVLDKMIANLEPDAPSEDA